MQLTHPYCVLFERGVWTVIGQIDGTVRLMGTSLKRRQAPHPDVPLAVRLLGDTPAPPSVRLKRYTTDAGLFTAGMEPATFQWYVITPNFEDARYPSPENFLLQEPLPQTLF